MVGVKFFILSPHETHVLWRNEGTRNILS